MCRLLAITPPVGSIGGMTLKSVASYGWRNVFLTTIPIYLCLTGVNISSSSSSSSSSITITVTITITITSTIIISSRNWPSRRRTAP